MHYGNVISLEPNEASSTVAFDARRPSLSPLRVAVGSRTAWMLVLLSLLAWPLAALLISSAFPLG